MKKEMIVLYREIPSQHVDSNFFQIHSVFSHKGRVSQSILLERFSTYFQADKNHQEKFIFESIDEFKKFCHSLGTSFRSDAVKFISVKNYFKMIENSENVSNIKDFLENIPSHRISNSSAEGILDRIFSL